MTIQSLIQKIHDLAEYDIVSSGPATTMLTREELCLTESQLVEAVNQLAVLLTVTIEK